MSLYETEYELNDVNYRIVCEDAASGLDGIDGKAWLFSVTDEATGKSVNVQAGVHTDLLVVWQESNGGTPVSNADLVALLAEHIKAGIQREQIDPDIVEDTEIDILTEANAAESVDDERRRLHDQLS